MIFPCDKSFALVNLIYVVYGGSASGRSESDDVTGQSTGKSIFCL